MRGSRVLLFTLMTTLAATMASGRPPAPRDALAGSWRFLEMGGTVLEAPASPEGRVPLLVFDGRGRVFASYLCNRVLGSYTLEQDHLRMDSLDGLQLACLKREAPARHLRETLAVTQRWRLDGGLLALYGEAGQPLAVLERVSPGG